MRQTVRVGRERCYELLLFVGSCDSPVFAAVSVTSVAEPRSAFSRYPFFIFVSPWSHEAHGLAAGPIDTMKGCTFNRGHALDVSKARPSRIGFHGLTHLECERFVHIPQFSPFVGAAAAQEKGVSNLRSSLCLFVLILHSRKTAAALLCA